MSKSRYCVIVMLIRVINHSVKKPTNHTFMTYTLELKVQLMRPHLLTKNIPPPPVTCACQSTTVPIGGRHLCMKVF